MFITILALVLRVLSTGHIDAQDVTIVAPVSHAQYKGDSGDESLEWFMFHVEAERDAYAEFNAIFNSYETKWSKNGRLMIRQGNSGSYKFVKKS